MSNDRNWTTVADHLDACRQQLRVCENYFAGPYHDHPHGEEVLEGEKLYLAQKLRETHLRMLLLIESLEVPLFHEQYVDAFKEFDGKLSKVEHADEDPETLYSDPLIFLGQTFKALKDMKSKAQETGVSELRLLERILKQTPHIVRDRGITPAAESEVQGAIYDVLKVVFPSAKRETKVSKIFKTYRIDLTIESLKAAIEVKYAVDETELKNEIDGVYADMCGYRGDSRWTHFFALFYTAEPIAYHERLIAEFQLSGADPHWKPIVVHGTGTRRSKEKSSGRAIPTRSPNPTAKVAPVRRAAGRSTSARAGRG